MTAVDFAVFVERLAQVSGEVILPFFRSAIGAEDKSRGGLFDPVTEADRGAEAAMRRLIGQTFPAHGVIGEEYGLDRPDAEYVWVLDPIDGTKSFISGMPTWGTLIGLMHRGRPVYGMMAQPYIRERFYGDGKRARLRTLATTRGDAPPSDWTIRTLRTRPCASLSEATLLTTSPMLIRDGSDREAYRRVERKVRLPRYGGDCYGYCAARRRLRRPCHRNQSQAPRHCRPDADHRGRRRHRYDLGRRGRGQGRTDSRGRRSTRVRRGAPTALGLTLRRRRRGRMRAASEGGPCAARRARPWRRRQTRPRRPRARLRTPAMRRAGAGSASRDNR